ncbi:MAG: hypothetical protein LAT51_06065 [Flavobacteriaceae bacterium]|nr:hypothetical protein [Flavobacteriaceae bacterium]
MKKKILIVSASFYPTNSPRSFRTTELVKEFLKQGHKVTLLSVYTDETLNYFKNEPNITFKPLKSEKQKKKVTVKKNKLLLLLNLIINRVKEQFFYYPQIKQLDYTYQSLKGLKGFDLMISIAAPHTIHWGVNKFIKKHHKPAKLWVADCGDPFMFAENLQYKRPFYFAYLEKAFCRTADFITVPSEKSISGYYNEFHDKIKVIPQGFNFDEIEVDQTEKKADEVQFAYAGRLNPKRRNPAELIDYLIEKNINFKFYIFSENFSFINGYQKKYPNKIILQNYIERKKLLKFLSSLDFVVNFKNKGDNQVPSKLIDYAIINKPILDIKYGNLDKGLVDEFLNADYKNSYKVDNLEQYKIENVCDNFLNLINIKS